MHENREELAKVARILDQFTFVINRGSRDNVEFGQHYLIFTLGETILDPDSGDSLGQLEVVLGRARVTHVQERIATLESTEREVTPGTVRRITRQSSGGIFSLTSGPTVEEVEEGRETLQLSMPVAGGEYARRL